jgi:AhpD family alkylhydroperoxidase
MHVARPVEPGALAPVHRAKPATTVTTGFAGLSSDQALRKPATDALVRELRTTSNVLEDSTLQSRMDHPAQTVPGAMQALQKLGQATRRAGVPDTTHELLSLRAGQINGCSGCVDIHSRMLKAAGEPDERIFMVAAWRESTYFTDAERAVLALTEAVTRIADRPDPVPDEVWDEAARHYDKAQLASIVLSIAAINAWNRLNVTTRAITGEWVEQLVSANAASAAA